MKRIFLIIIFIFSIVSCTTDKYKQNYYYNIEVLPVDSYVMPTIYGVNLVSTITVRYKIPTTCYNYHGFYYAKNGFTRTIGIQATNYNYSNCQIDGLNIYEASLNFKPAISGSYIFKFYIGTNLAGVDLFATETVIVP